MVDAVAKVSLLVVDDSLTSCIVLAKQLQKLGYDVDMANGGKEALAKLDSKQYQLMLLDYFMPDMDGFEVAKHIRTQEKDAAKHLPIIGVSGETDQSHKDLCIKQGMDGVLEKPVDNEALQNMIQLWCAAPVEQQSSYQPVKVSKADLHILFNEATVQDLADLQKAIAANDVGASQRLVHRMKGAALTLGKHVIADYATQLEQQFKNSTIKVQLCQRIIEGIEQEMRKSV